MLAEAICCGEGGGVVLLKPFSVQASYIASGRRIGWVTNVTNGSSTARLSGFHALAMPTRTVKP